MIYLYENYRSDAETKKCKDRTVVTHTLLNRKWRVCRQVKSANPAGDFLTLKHSEFTS